MILVTVGNATQGFSRLLKAVDDLAADGFFKGEPVFLQTGYTRDFNPRHCDAQAFVPSPDFDRLMRSASLLITHGGCTVLQAIRAGKYPVVMPRRRNEGEHINDHQITFVRELATLGHIIPAYFVADLPAAIARVRTQKGIPLPPSRMVELAGQAIRELA